jgi:hypothetical protein
MARRVEEDSAATPEEDSVATLEEDSVATLEEDSVATLEEDSVATLEVVGGKDIELNASCTIRNNVLKEKKQLLGRDMPNPSLCSNIFVSVVMILVPSQFLCALLVPVQYVRLF